MTTVTPPAASTTVAATYFEHLARTDSVPGTEGHWHSDLCIGWRAPFVEMKTVYDKIRSLKNTQDALPFTQAIVIADTIHFDESLRFYLSGHSIILIARDIIVENGASLLLDAQNDGHGVILAYCQTMSGGPLPVILRQTDGQAGKHSLSPPPPGHFGHGLHLHQGRLVPLQSEKLDSRYFSGNIPFYQAMMAQYHMATLVMHERTALTRAMSLWIARCAVQIRETQPQALRWFRLATEAEALARMSDLLAVNFVPYLNPALYRDAAASAIAVARAISVQYERLGDRSLQISDRKQAGRQMLEQYGNSVRSLDFQIERANANYQAAIVSATETARKLRLHAVDLALARHDLMAAIKVFQNEAKVNTAINLVCAILTLGAAIATLGAAAIPAGATTAVQTRNALASAPKSGLEKALSSDQDMGAIAAGGSDPAPSMSPAPILPLKAMLDKAIPAQELNQMANPDPGMAASSVSTALKSAEAVADSSSRLAACLKSVADITKSLATLVESTTRIVDLSKKLFSNQTQLDTVRSMVTPVDSIADLAAWDIFRTETTAKLKPLESANVPRTQEFRTCLEVLATLGKAAAEAQQAVVRTGQELSVLTIQRTAASQDVERTRRYIEGLDQEQQDSDAASQEFYQMFLDVKRSIYLSVMTYRWSYKFWALNESQVQPRINASLIDLENNLNTIQRDTNTAYESFSPSPQEMAVSVTIDDPDNIRTLLRDGQIQLAIGLDHPMFKGYDRVRLNTIRVWLNGIACGPQDSARLRVYTSGHHQDRYRGIDWAFVTAPRSWAFEYLPTSRAIRIDGKVAEEAHAAYFLPTPFTHWTISARLSSGAPLTGITGLTLEFRGSMIPGQTY